MLRILYGGTFDPVHTGHIAVATAARDALAGKVYFLPSGDPPHRPAPGASAEQRVRMIALAIAGQENFFLDRRELERAGPSYTIDTLRELRGKLAPETPLAWLVGDDAFRQLATWHDWRSLFELCHFVIATRPGYALDDLHGDLAQMCAGRWSDQPAALSDQPAGRLYRLAMPLHPASASAIRRSLAAGRGDRGWLPPLVAEYVRKQGLYAARV
ncbi:MAG TPA: nicotinate-nucleotide adenylyltransferase [Arenimonas sp.]|uniref:nicotinate-nucleotide adenylyltransferase n=1 Tax=Arenimonas sp. TaxID=1872635 RepID=UPI002BEC4508|nr:nicotinate-nucleotide adenylyltransferase [Arenimonas sp.]HMB55845.1 nicotinate-nucleotide adenylyltransferase [Arenimonas sp.]